MGLVGQGGSSVALAVKSADHGSADREGTQRVGATCAERGAWGGAGRGPSHPVLDSGLVRCSGPERSKLPASPG